MLYTSKIKFNSETRGGSYNPEKEPKPGDSTSQSQNNSESSEFIKRVQESRKRIAELGPIPSHILERSKKQAAQAQEIVKQIAKDRNPDN
jgi:hypothetical protein